MEILTLDEIVHATGGSVVFEGQRSFSGLSIDSRKIRRNELFIALPGERFDGHDFVNDALAVCAGAVVSAPSSELRSAKTLIYVKDTLKALQDIARYRRSKRNVPVIAVTGTNGKTTTKELIVSILLQKHGVLKTSGNLNNHIGLPLCMANMSGDEDFMVLEMGSNRRGDIKELCEIAHPDYSVTTNAGPAHLEGFGSLEAVRDTDLELLSYVKVAAMNADDLFLMKGINNFSGRIITYGIENRADIYAKNIIQNERGTQFTMCLPDKEEIEILLRISGRFNVYNALAAASMAYEPNIGSDDIKRGLEIFSGVPMRLEIKEISGSVIISDVYNANPSSMEAALIELVRLKRNRSIAVLGDMLELGAYARDAHRELVRQLNKYHIDVLIAVGPEMKEASSEFSGTCHKTDSSEEAGPILMNILRTSDTVLVKGSRGMRMEKVTAGSGDAVVSGGINAV